MSHSLFRWWQRGEAGGRHACSTGHISGNLQQQASELLSDDMVSHALPCLQAGRPASSLRHLSCLSAEKGCHQNEAPAAMLIVVWSEKHQRACQLSSSSPSAACPCQCVECPVKHAACMPHAELVRKRCQRFKAGVPQSLSATAML